MLQYFQWTFAGTFLSLQVLGFTYRVVLLIIYRNGDGRHQLVSLEAFLSSLSLLQIVGKERPNISQIMLQICGSLAKVQDLMDSWRRLEQYLATMVTVLLPCR